MYVEYRLTQFFLFFSIKREVIYFYNSIQIYLSFLV